MSSTPLSPLPSISQAPLLPRENQGQQQFSQRLAPYAEQGRENKSENPLKKTIVLFAPALSLLGGLGLLAGAILERKPNALKPLIGKSINSEQAVKLTNNSTKVLSVAFLFGAWNDTLSGITNKQPSMLFSGVLQFIPAALLALPRLKVPQDFIWNLWTFLAAVWTLGFANDMVNKDFSAGNEKPRTYDMKRFLSTFQPSSNLSFIDRFRVFGNESKKMFSFMVQDHKQLAEALSKKPAKNASEKQRFDWKGMLEPSVYLTRLSVALTYLGAIPSLLWFMMSKKPEATLFKIPTGLLRAGALTLANLSFFDLAIHRDDLKGKMPLLGAPLTTIGIAFPHNHFMRSSSQIGEGLNSLFVSDVALKGIPKNKHKPDGNPQMQTPPAPQQPMFYEHHQTAHRHPGSNALQNGGIQA